MTQTFNLNLNIAVCDDDAADRKRSFDLTAELMGKLLETKRLMLRKFCPFDCRQYLNFYAILR